MYGLKKVTVSRPTFSCPGLQMVPYRYPKFGHAPGREPESTFFGRTVKGGLLTGLEYSYDSSALNGENVTLEFAPGLKVRKDLPDWPATGKVDGTAHIVGDHGLICLFNSSATQLTGEFALTEKEAE